MLVDYDKHDLGVSIFKIIEKKMPFRDPIPKNYITMLGKKVAT